MLYAVEYAYGPDVVNQGARPNVLVRFRFQKDQRRWVAEGIPIRGPAFREALSAHHPYVRYSQRHPEGWEREGTSEFYRMQD